MWGDEIFFSLLDCNLVKGRKIRPIFGRKVCIGRNIIEYRDNNKLNPLRTTEGELFTNSVHRDAPLSFDQLLHKFPRVFGDGVGKLPGEYNMKLIECMSPVQHLPRWVPVAIQNCLKEMLQDLKKQEIII